MNRKLTVLIFLSVLLTLPASHLCARPSHHGSHAGFSLHRGGGRTTIAGHIGTTSGHHHRRSFRHHRRPHRTRYVTSPHRCYPRGRHFGHHGSRGHTVIRTYGCGRICPPRYPVYDRTYYYTPPSRTVYIHSPAPSVIIRERPTVRVIDPHPVRIMETGPDLTYVSLQEQLTSQVLLTEPDKRLEAARKLSEYPNINAVAVLVDVLVNDADPRVRAAAATSLGKIGDPIAYEALLRSNAAERQEQVQNAAQNAAELLGDKVGTRRIKVSSVFPPMNQGSAKLAEHLEDLRFGTDKVRERAAEKMADHKGTQAVTALINTMINDAGDDVREEAAESLGKIGDRMAMPFLKWTCNHDHDESTRKDADKSIEKLN